MVERERLLESLREQMQRLEGGRAVAGRVTAGPGDTGPGAAGPGDTGWDERGELFSSGCAELDRLLPEGGWRRGVLVEWLAATAGSGAGSLALLVARQAASSGGVLVVLDRQGHFYPPAAAAWGVDLGRLLVVRPRQDSEELWALDQALRCPGVAAVWAALERLDWRAFRRLQLAAELGGSLGLLVRPARIRGQPTWSQVQLEVRPRMVPATGTVPGPSGAPRPSAFLGPGGRRVCVELVRCRLGGASGGVGRSAAVELELDETCGAVRVASGRHETHPLHLAATLAHPAAARRSARA